MKTSLSTKADVINEPYFIITVSLLKFWITFLIIDVIVQWKQIKMINTSFYHVLYKKRNGALDLCIKHIL